MKNLRGIIVAAVFAALTGIAVLAAKHFNLLMGMAYPFASKTIVEYMGTLTGKVDFCVWQAVVAVFLVAVVVSFGLTILFRWNILRWLGWVLAPVSITYFLLTLVWGLNAYTRPLSESMKLPAVDYTVSDLKEAALFYRQEADRLADQVRRDANGDMILPELDTLAEIASNSYDNLVWDYSVFAGARGPVKELGWSDRFSAYGVDGVTVGLTGEAAVNLSQYASRIPFNVCHEMAHLLAIAREDEAGFAGFLACSYSDDVAFRYSGYLEAFLYCVDSLYEADQATWRDAWDGASELLLHDVAALNEVAASRDGPTKDKAQAAYNTYLESSGQENGVETYGEVTDLLVAWYQEKYVIDDTPEPTQFDPLKYEDVFPETETPTETTEEG